VAINLWAAILSALVATQLLRLPGANFLQNFSVLIALYMPISLLIGWLNGQIAIWLEQRLGGKQFAFSVILIGISLWAAWNQGQTVLAPEPASVLVTRPDQRALAWIREHTPPEASFLVEGSRIDNGHSIVGSDAGWWMPLLAGRANTIPPQYAVLNEEPSPSDYTQRAVELVAQLEKTSLNSPEGIRLMCLRGLTHVYIGQRQGRVGFDATQLFSPAELSDNAAFDLVYHTDRVYIFQLKPSACHPGS